MNVLQVHSTDFDGRIFNGYDLQRALNERGIDTKQIVYKKLSEDENVILQEYPRYIYERLQYEEQMLAMNNLLTPWGHLMRQSDAYDEADIIHYHMVHHKLISLFDLAADMNRKPAIWTIHDPWIVTGHCIYPLDCEGWKEECQQCGHIDWAFPLKHDKAHQHWKIKEILYREMKPDIVVSSQFMKSYVEQSPLTEHFDKIHVIPFGLDEAYFSAFEKQQKRKYGIDENKIVIGFRASGFHIKGCYYIYQMMERLGDINKKIVYISIGDGQIPENVAAKYEIKQWGWKKQKEEIIEFYGVCDIFLMPSLAETFGLMAIEAMAQRCSVICFKNTVLEEITEAPEIGCAAAYCDSKALAEIVQRLVNNTGEIRYRGEQGREFVKRNYRFEDYVQAHAELYYEVQERNRKRINV